MSSTTAGAPPAAATAGARVETPFRRFVAEFAESRIALFGLVAFAAIVLLALLAPWIAPQNPYDLAQLDIMDGRLEPCSVGGAGFTYWLGTDDQGRDMLSAIIYGLRISLAVGAVSVVIACAVGCIRPWRDDRRYPDHRLWFRSYISDGRRMVHGSLRRSSVRAGLLRCRAGRRSSISRSG